MHRVFQSLMAFGFVALGAVLPANAASFDCAQARKPDEIAICSNPDLSALDSEMGGLWFAFSKVPFLMGANGVRRDEADDFLSKRAACGSDVSCLREGYHARIASLRDSINRSMDDIFRQENADPVIPLWSAATLPAPVQKVADDYSDQCRQLGGALSGDASSLKIMTGDLDGDGTQDYVLNPQDLRCSAAATAFCGNGGCQIKIALSANGYEQPTAVLGGEPTLKSASVEVWVDGSNCNLSDRDKNCWGIFSWKDGVVSKDYQARRSQD